MSTGIFLNATWKMVAMLNYRVDPRILAPYCPAGTELDLFQRNCYVSLVGFRFLNTRVKGWSIPFHRNFDEVNLRFYVRCKTDLGASTPGVVDGYKRGVCFIKELVPRFWIAAIARWFYNENYQALPMHSHIELPDETNQNGRGSVRYSWKASNWQFAEAHFKGQPQPLTPGSEADFIAEHYWGYARQTDGGTVEYQVEHPPWRIWPATASQVCIDAERLYGSAFARLFDRQADSAFVAEGSEVTVRNGRRI